MCVIDWSLVAALLGGIGTLLVGIAAVTVLPKQLGYRKEAKELQNAITLMRQFYRQYMASEEGIIWRDYPADADDIVRGITERTGLDAKNVREMLDALKKEGKI